MVKEFERRREDTPDAKLTADDVFKKTCTYNVL